MFGDGVVFVLVLPKGFVVCCTRDDACQAFEEGENPFTFMNQVLQRDVAPSSPPYTRPRPSAWPNAPSVTWTANPPSEAQRSPVSPYNPKPLFKKGLLSSCAIRLCWIWTKRLFMPRPSPCMAVT